ENQYSKGLDINIVYNLPRARGKYIAMCEGDDYWIDPLKLQKQVDFLESHTDYSMCFHSVWKLENGNTSRFVNIAKSEISAWDIINNWLVPTCSVLYRKISLDWVLCNKIGGFCGDFNIFINLSQHGRIHYISDMMGVYRIHSQGVTMTHLNSIKSQKAMLNQINRMSFYYPKIRKDLIYQYVSASVSYASCAIKRGNFTLFIYFLYKAFTKDLIKTNINIFSRTKQKFVKK
ncbi:glycosyl transferase, partial [Bacteroides sp. FSHCM14E1]